MKIYISLLNNFGYLTIPAVIVCWRERGQPIATTQSPGSSLHEEPSFADGSGVLDVIFTIAISECKSAFTTVPTNVRPSCKVTSTFSRNNSKSNSGVHVILLRSTHTLALTFMFIALYKIHHGCRHYQISLNSTELANSKLDFYHTEC